MQRILVGVGAVVATIVALTLTTTVQGAVDPTDPTISCQSDFKLLKAQRCLGFPECADTPLVQPVSASTDDILNGMFVSANVIRPACWPRWMNRTKFAQGQAFQRKNYGAVTLSQIMSIISGFFFDETTDILLFTSTNDCNSSFIRNYGSLFRNMKLWGDADIKDPNQQCALLQSLIRSNQVHQKVAARLERIIGSGNVANGGFPRNFTAPIFNATVWDAFKADLEASFTEAQLAFDPNYIAKKNSPSRVPFSMFQVGSAVMTFSGASTLSKVNAMVPGASDDDIEAFNHMWGVIGHVVGIDDTYNAILQANFTEQQRYYKEMQTRYQIPSAYHMSDWAKMFAETALTKFVSAPLYINGLDVPNPVPVDGWLMSVCAAVLGIPFDNLRAVASPVGLTLVTAITTVQATMKDLAASPTPAAYCATESILADAIGLVINGTATKAYGTDYTCATQCDIADKIHYEYLGPDINFYGWNYSLPCNPLMSPNLPGYQPNV